LDNLLHSDRISQSTYDSFNREIDEALAETERQQRLLMEKMNSKMEELEGQIRTLEMLLANSEIQHVTGELDDEVYQRETDMLSSGLETAKRELDSVKEAMEQLSDGYASMRHEAVIEHEEKAESPPNENNATSETVEAAEKIPKSVVELIEVCETSGSEAQEHESTTENSEEAAPSLADAQGEEAESA